MKDFSLSIFGTFKNEITEELKNAKHNHLEDMVNRTQLTFDEIIVILDIKYFAGSNNRYNLSAGIFIISDISLILKSLPPKEVKVNVTNDDSRLRSNLTTYEILMCLKSLFST